MSALSRAGGPFALCLALAFAAAWGVSASGAQPADFVLPADSAAAAESLRIADSIAVADSIAFEEAAAAEAAETFGTSRSILDRQRNPGFLTYNTSYAVNRGNRTWTQGADFYVSPGPVQVANQTSITIGKEERAGRENRNRSTRTEIAYRVAPWLRLGGALGLQRISDDATTANFVPLRQDNDDISAQARFNKRFGPYPVSGLVSYGYLDNQQFQQNSKGNTFGVVAATSRSFGAGSNLSLDVSQQKSRLTSTVADDAEYLQDDRNNIRDVRLSGNVVISRWLSADGRANAQRSRVERPARVPEDPNDFSSELVVKPEAVDGELDNADAALHFRLPRGAVLNVAGTLGRNRQVYQTEVERTSIASNQSFRADYRQPFLGLDPSITYENSVAENDLTRRNPGWVESNLTRRLDISAGKILSRTLTSRLSAAVTLTRRRYEDFVSDLVGTTAPSNQDNRRARGSLNLTYRPSPKFDTGITAGLEENEIVALAQASSINNTKQRTYSVAWNWTARPGSGWFVTQNNSATAAQQYYTFSPDRDQLSFIYNISTLISTTLSRSIRLELNNVLRLQSRGSWRLVEEERFYGKSSEFNTLDLSLRTIYTATDWLTLEAQERLSVSPNFTVSEGQSVKTNESRRAEFTGIARINLPLSGSAFLNGDVRRTLATDRQLTYGSAPTDRYNDNDYWLANIAFRKTFGGPTP